MTDMISIVVPTRDRPQSLARCLASLAAQGAIALDVVVVDDGSRDRGAIDAAATVLDTTRVVSGPRRGPAAARNLGARAAEGEVICFIDDDCIATSGWAAALSDAATAVRDSAGLGVAAGRTSAPPDASAAVAASQAIVEYLTAASLHQDGEAVRFAPSCNLAATRETLRRLPFDESYRSAAGEDRDWCARVVAAGVEIAWEPAARVIHQQELDGARDFLRQQYRYGRGAAQFRRGAADRRLAGPSFYAGLVRWGFEAGPAVGAIVVAAQAAVAAGVVAERFTGLGRTA